MTKIIVIVSLGVTLGTALATYDAMRGMDERNEIKARM